VFLTFLARANCTLSIQLRRPDEKQSEQKNSLNNNSQVGLKGEQPDRSNTAQMEFGGNVVK
jgi:hypothetical protein